MEGKAGGFLLHNSGGEVLKGTRKYSASVLTETFPPLCVLIKKPITRLYMLPILHFRYCSHNSIFSEKLMYIVQSHEPSTGYFFLVGHLLKIKCVHSRVNVNIKIFNKCPIH